MVQVRIKCPAKPALDEGPLAANVAGKPDYFRLSDKEVKAQTYEVSVTLVEDNVEGAPDEKDLQGHDERYHLDGGRSDWRLRGVLNGRSWHKAACPRKGPAIGRAGPGREQMQAGPNHALARLPEVVWMRHGMTLVEFLVVTCNRVAY